MDGNELRKTLKAMEGKKKNLPVTNSVSHGTSIYTVKLKLTAALTRGEICL